MDQNPVEKLMALGFSEYEAKAYIALLRESPVTGYQLSKLSGVPRSMIYEVLGKLMRRGAVMALRQDRVTRYAPVPMEDFLEQLQREYEELITALKRNLGKLSRAPNPEYVWNLEGQESILARAEEMIRDAQREIYLWLIQSTLPHLRTALEEALHRGVRVVIYSPDPLEVPGARIITTALSEEAYDRVEGLWLILVVDKREVLVGEQLEGFQAKASWTSNPLLVFIVEHHLRTDPYLPRILACLGDQARDIIREEDLELFARAMESHIRSAE